MESLPNIVGEFTPNNASGTAYPGMSATTTGAFFKLKIGKGTIMSASSSSTDRYSVNFNASHSSSTYQDDASVYPNSVSTLLIIKC